MLFFYCLMLVETELNLKLLGETDWNGIEHPSKRGVEIVGYGFFFRI